MSAATRTIRRSGRLRAATARWARPLIAAVLAVCPVAPTDPATFTIGVIVDDAESVDESAFVAGLQAAVDDWNAQQPTPAARLAVATAAASRSAMREACQSLVEQGAGALIGPLQSGGDAAAAARSSGVPHLGLDAPTEDVAAALAELLCGRLRVQRIGFVTDGAREARALDKALTSAVPYPCSIAARLDVDAADKAIEKTLERDPVQALVIDASPEAARLALDGPLGRRAEPIFLTDRAYSAATRGASRDAFCVLGRSPAAVGGGSAFLSDWRKQHGEPAYAVAEGYEAAMITLRCLTDRANRGELEGFTRIGPRGRVTVVDGQLSRPLALWRMNGERIDAYLPPPIPAEILELGTASIKEPDPDLGVPFGAWRSDAFALEEDTQWVLFDYGEGAASTIDDDLAKLGLSSSGRAPLVDHLIKEELMARLLAFTSSKFLREWNGAAIPGKSLRISFATHLPPKAKKGKAWRCQVAGDDEGAGGRAWPGQGRAEIYSTFIRRTIFQPHALDPPVGQDDLPYLDGSYRFGDDRLRDKRSELIRALINGYGGSMALTAAHEIGHIAGLGHITDDAVGIMNVDEGAGIDHLDGRFSAGSMEKLIDRLGVTPEPKKRRRD